MPVETCLSTLLSLVVSSVAEEEGGGGGRLYFERKHDKLQCWIVLNVIWSDQRIMHTA